MSAETQQLEGSSPSAAANHSDSPSHRRSSRSRRSSHSRRHSHRFGYDSLLVPALSVALVILLLVAVFSGMKIASLNRTNGILRTQLDKKQDELTQLRPELAEARAEARKDLESLVESRFPQLHKLEFDKVIPVHDEYVRNILFTLIKKNDERRHEYRLLMENTAPASVLPEVRVVLFDRLGVQLGMDQLEKQEPLASGESRSFSSFIETFVEGEPRYFYISVKGGAAGLDAWPRAKKDAHEPAP
jgi:hypothetical protein